MIISHPGGLNEAALMDSFCCMTLHFITPVCQLELTYKVSEGMRNVKHQSVIAAERRWLDWSLINMAARPSVIPHGCGMTHFSPKGNLEGIKSMQECTCGGFIQPLQRTFSEVFCFCTGGTYCWPYTPVSLCLHRWFVFTEPCECCTASWIQGVWMVINEKDMAVLFSGLHIEVSKKN